MKTFPINGVLWSTGGKSSKSSNINAHGGDLDITPKMWLCIAGIVFLFYVLPAVVDTQSRKQQAKKEQSKKIEQLNASRGNLTSKQSGQKTLYLHPKMFQNCKNY